MTKNTTSKTMKPLFGSFLDVHVYDVAFLKIVEFFDCFRDGDNECASSGLPEFAGNHESRNRMHTLYILLFNKIYIARRNIVGKQYLYS